MNQKNSLPNIEEKPLESIPVDSNMKRKNPLKCPDCLGDVPAKARKCAHCGSYLPRKSLFLEMIVLAIILSIFTGGALMMWKQRKEDREALNHINLLLRNTPTETSDPVFTLKQEADVRASIVKIICPIVDPNLDWSQVSTFEDIEALNGSGIIMDSSGVVVTNFHVIPHGHSPDHTIRMAEGQICFVHVPKSDLCKENALFTAIPVVHQSISDLYDLALLKISRPLDESNGVPEQFPSLMDAGIESCKSNRVNYGDPVYIYGYPEVVKDYSIVVTDGIISSKLANGMLLTSASIDAGNSGGLALGKDNCFIGMPAQVLSGDLQNLGVIIPTEVINDYLTRIQEK